MVTMHGFFDLKDGLTEAHFKKAYDDFGAHLTSQRMIISYKVMRRSFHSGYDSGAPETRFYVSMDFEDLAQANACWDYIEEKREGSHGYHAKVYAQIKNASFFLSEEIPAGESPT